MRKSISELEEKLNKVRSDILVLETLGIKPNYSELSRIYNVDRRTIQKYKDGYSKNKETKNRKSKLEPFNIFSATLGASRLHVFLYSKFKTRIDVQRCLVETFEYIGGVTKELLTDNMSSIVNTKTGKFYKEFISFAKDMGTFAKHCKPRHPYTKGKDESANRFMSWLVPYNHEFEDEQDLIRIIKEINLKVNNQVNSSIGVAPVMLYKKEKECANMLFQLINKRYEKGSTIITTNKPFSEWGELFGDSMIANAILDRLLHHSHIINITGNSYRLKDKFELNSE